MAEIMEAKIVRGIRSGQALAVDDGLVDPLEMVYVDELTAEALEMSREIVYESPAMSGAQQEIAGQIVSLTVIARRHDKSFRSVTAEIAELLRRAWEVIDDGWAP